MNKSNNNKTKTSIIKSYESFASLWLKYFIIGDIIAAILFGIFYFLLKSQITSNLAIIKNINTSFSNIIDTVMAPGETYLGILSLVFIVTSLVSVLSDKSETIYWLSVMDFKLVNPQYFNLVSISAFLASCVLLATISLICFPEYVYICLVVVVILLFALSMKMLSGFFYKEKSMEQLKIEFIVGNILEHIDSEIKAYFDGLSEGFIATAEFNLEFLLKIAKTNAELITYWTYKYNTLGQQANKNVADTLTKNPVLNDLVDLLVKLNLYNFENPIDSMVLANDMSTELVEHVDRLIDQNSFLNKDELLSSLNDFKPYSAWYSDRKELIAKKTVFLYGMKKVHDLLSIGSIDNAFSTALKAELPILGITPDPSVHLELEDLIDMISSIDNYSYIKDEIKKIDLIVKKYSSFNSINAYSFKENKDALVSITMNYIDNLEIEKLRDNLNLLIYTARKEEEHQIMSHLSEVNPEIFITFLQKINLLKYVVGYKDIYEPLIYKFIADNSYPNALLRLIDFLYLTEVKEAATNYDNVTSRYYITPEYRIPKLFKTELEKVNTRLYNSLLPINEIMLQVAETGNYLLLKSILTLMNTITLSDIDTSSYLYSNMCSFMGYSRWAIEMGYTFDSKLKILSVYLPEYYTKLQNIIIKALNDEKLSSNDYNTIDDLLHNYRRTKYLAHYISTMSDKYNKLVDILPLHKYIDNNRYDPEIQRILYRISEPSIIPGEYYLKQSEMIQMPSDPSES